MTDEAALRARHQDSGYPHRPERCDWCGLDWPCDAAQAFALLDASREREKALADALQRVMDDVTGGYEVGIGATGQAFRALSAYRAALPTRRLHT